MTDRNKLDEKEAKDLAEQLARKYSFGEGDINAILTKCGIDLECIRRTFEGMANSKKLKDAVKSFQREYNGPELA